MDEVSEISEVEVVENPPEHLEVALEQPLKALLESLFFVSAEPLSIEKLATVVKKEQSAIKTALGELENDLKEANRGIELVSIANKFQLRTKSVFAPVVRDLFAVRPKKLSQPALETLAVIAYQQPVVKSEIEKVRGVDVSPTLKTLLERELISIVGYQQTAGQPALYGTTENFLKVFGLRSLKEMPSLRMIREIESEPGEVEETEAANG